MLLPDSWRGDSLKPTVNTKTFDIHDTIISGIGPDVSHAYLALVRVQLICFLNQKNTGVGAFDRVVPHVWQTFLRNRGKVRKTVRNPLIFSCLRFSRTGEKGMKRRENDRAGQRRQTEPNRHVFNDFCVQAGEFSGSFFSGRTCKMYQNSISALLQNCAGTLVQKTT